MPQFLDEVDASFASFSARWPQEAAATKTALDAMPAKFIGSYRRLVSFQAWSDQLLGNVVSPESLQFFLEAQNDALLSHVAARSGMWRTAMQALRSCIENVLACLYYKDHPVELALWQQGRHRPGFSELHKYFIAHPLLKGVKATDSGLDLLADEYAVLSKAVHASAAAFRMTHGVASPTLWIPDPRRLGMWASREAATLKAVNMLLLSLYHSELAGAQRRDLRRAIGLTMTRPALARLQIAYGVRFPLA